MEIQINNIRGHPEGVEITAVVYSRSLPKPHYQDNETDEQYATRVATTAEDINGFCNLHIGWADLKQEPITINIPTVAEYDT